ncbi:MAG TPA: sulfatase-like hydrolase/transferase [Geminicoccus sp.]|nr:sulfatase-like hydrolase/transferase [Geminicoccus sp.]
MVLAGGTSPASGNEVLSGKERKDIIFIIMDDVGIDQLKLFGYGGDNPPRTPNLVKIADRGVRFTNVWAMPECSPSRATFFSGRYPIRTGVEAAIVDNHIPQTYLSSFEATLPRLLSDAGYKRWPCPASTTSATRTTRPATAPRPRAASMPSAAT